MNTQQRLATLAVIIFTTLGLYAQRVSDDDVLKMRAAEKAGQMNDYISMMASKKKSRENRLYYRQKALNLFVGKGFEYDENGVSKKGVMMETTSVNNPTKRRELMRDYFQRVVDYRYSDVTITSTDVAMMKVSALQQIDDDTFVCTCQFDQAFIGYRDGVPQYKDITTKRVKCYIKKERTEAGIEYIVRLGDVSAISTTKM